MNHFQQSVVKRSANKLATTNLTNELVDAINALGTGVIGGVFGGGILSAVLVRVDSKAGGKGKYLGVVKLGPLVTDEDSDLDSMDDDMDDGQKCLIVNQAETDKNTTRIPLSTSDNPTIILGWIVGVMNDDSGRPVIWINYNYAVRNVRYNETTFCLEQTFEDKEDPDTATYENIDCTEECV